MKMDKKALIILLLTLFIGVPIFSSPILAIDDEDEEYSGVDKANTLEDILGDVIPVLVDNKIGKLEVGASASFVSGFDTNVNLNRYDEDGSFYTQKTLGLSGEYPLSDIATLRGTYDFTWIKYFKFSDPDLMDNIFGTGLDVKIDDNYQWSIDYRADFVDFPYDKVSQYNTSEIETVLRHDIKDWLYQKIGYSFAYKYYPKWKSRNDWGTIRLRNRKDRRNTVFHQLGAYLGDRTFIKTENRAYLNDSNELFLDYYDYRVLRTKASITHLITDKLYESVNFAYQYKAFFKRSVSDNEFDQRDHLFTCGSSIFYDIFPSVSIGASFDFRKNLSNENEQKYEDFIVSSGVYCIF